MPKMSCHEPKIGKIELKMAFFFVVVDCAVHVSPSGNQVSACATTSANDPDDMMCVNSSKNVCLMRWESPSKEIRP